MIPTTFITREPLIITDIRKSIVNPQSGAIVLFEGCARDNSNNLSVQSLVYEAFIPMAEKELQSIRQEAITIYQLHQCIIHHRLGKINLTETALVVACSAAHREEAFKAIIWIVDRIKKRVPIWKCEIYTDETTAWQ